MNQVVLDASEKQKHEEAIEMLCEDYPAQKEFIRETYSEILERVSPEARIRTFLTILISREVKALLKMRELTHAS